MRRGLQHKVDGLKAAIDLHKVQHAYKYCGKSQRRKETVMFALG